MMKILMSESLPNPAEYIHTIGKVDLITSAKTLTVAEDNLLIQPGNEDCQKTLLAPLSASYDYIIVDTGPVLDSLTINASTAADEIIIPIDSELFPVVCLSDLSDTIGKIQRHLNPAIKIS